MINIPLHWVLIIVGVVYVPTLFILAALDHAFALFAPGVSARAAVGLQLMKTRMLFGVSFYLLQALAIVLLANLEFEWGKFIAPAWQGALVGAALYLLAVGALALAGHGLAWRVLPIGLLWSAAAAALAAVGGGVAGYLIPKWFA